MRIMAWWLKVSRGERDRAEGIDEGAGGPYGSETSGPLGFGHRAHQPDPNAEYQFENDPNYRVHHPETP